MSQNMNINMNRNRNIAGAGVLNSPRVRDVGRYGDRLRERRTYPNRRRRIITGKELTTPLIKKETAQRAVREKVNMRIKTVSVEKKIFPTNAIFSVLIIAFVLICLICSYIVLYERNVEINELEEKIASEIDREKILKNQLDSKNDLSYILNYAVTNLDMVSEDLIQKYYISDRLEDKVEILNGKDNSTVDFPLMSSIFGGKN